MIALGRGGRPLRVAYGRIFHEANANSPLLTGLDGFENRFALAGDELAAACELKGKELPGLTSAAELTGFVQAARAAGGVKTVPLASRLAVPSGPLTQSAFFALLDEQLERLDGAGPVDGIYLALHGSMEVQGLPQSPEAVILDRVRQTVGPVPKIAASFDLHAHLSPEVVEPLDVLVAYRTNPHWDLAPTGFRAGNRLIRALRGQIRPVHAFRKLPMVLGGGITIDFLPPMRSVFRHLRRLERDRRVLTASLLMVHPFTSAPDLGWAVHVSTDGDPELAERLADEIADRVWAVRDVPLPPMLGVDEAIEEARRSPWRRLGPVTFVDADDVVGAGAPGGNTRIVAGLLGAGAPLTAYVPVHDPALVEATWDLEVGETSTFVLRGTPGYGQPEVRLEAKVAAKVDYELGRLVRLDAGRLQVAVAEQAPLPIHPRFWRQLGLEPRRADVLVQKNFFHYRLFYAGLSFHHLPVVTAGASSLQAVQKRAAERGLTPYPPDWRPRGPGVAGSADGRSGGAWAS